MSTVEQILEHKGRAIWKVRPDTSVLDALGMMADKGAGALLVMSGDQLVGIFSERDHARKGVLQGRDPRHTPVSAVLTRPVLCVSPDHTVEECMALMTEKRHRHLPVQVEGRIVGVVSIGDVVRAIISEQQFVIAQLEHYIAGV
jgi:CBS domain-containing protein